MKHYTIEEASELLSISIRSLQIKCKKNNIPKLNSKYLISGDLLNEWVKKDVKKTRKEATRILNERPNNIREDIREDESETIIEEFSPEQYEKLQEVIHTYPVLLDRIKDYKNEIEYLRTSLDKTHDQFEMLLKRMESTLQIVAQRNFIEAKTKIDPEDFGPPY